MDKKNLISLAEKLNSPSSKALKLYAEKSEVLIAKINERLLGREDIGPLTGGNTEMMKDNHANHVRFMLSVFDNFKAEVLVDTVLWVFRAYRSHGFTTNYWAAQMNAWIGILKEELDDSAYQQILPFYHWFQVNIPTFVALSDGEIDAHHSMH